MLKLLYFLGLDKTELPSLDGMDMWKCISEGTKCPRNELIYNIDDIVNYGALRIGDLKYMYGSTNGGKADKWFGNSGKSDIYIYDDHAVLSSKGASALAGLITRRQIREKNKFSIMKSTSFSVNPINKITISRLRQEATITCPEVNHELQSNECNLMKAPCLFNITHDPCERINLAQEKPIEMLYFKQIIERYRKSAIPPRNIPQDPDADPIKWNNTWTNWVDYKDGVGEEKIMNDLSPLAIGLLIFTLLIVLFVIMILIILNIKQLHTCGKNNTNTCLFGNRHEDPIVNITQDKNCLFENRQIQNKVCLREELRTLE